jgi:hypothetical protein
MMAPGRRKPIVAGPQAGLLECRPPHGRRTLAYLVGRFPVERRSGTFVVKIANTTWRREAVRFDTPTPDRQPRYSVLDRDPTSGERQDCA